MRVLVTSGSGLGNVVMATPTVAAVAALGHEVVLGLDKITAPFRSLWENWDVVSRTACVGDHVRADVVVKTCWGHRGPAFQCASREFEPMPMSFKDHHEVDVNLSAIRALGHIGPAPSAYVGWDECDSVSGDFVAFLTACKPGPLWARKRWPDERWIELAGCFYERDLPVVFLGGKADSRPWMNVHGCDYCGELPLRQAMGVLKHARVAVAIDCGLAHCAAALGTPTVVLNGPTSPTKNRPLGPNVVLWQSSDECAPCHYTERWRTCEHPGRCMEALSVSGAYERAVKLCER